MKETTITIKDELLEGLFFNSASLEDILCIELIFNDGSTEAPIYLQKNYTKEELDTFLNKIDKIESFETTLQNGYVWFKNSNVWLELEDNNSFRDPKLVWSLYVKPSIPEECIKSKL